ncbi:MAG: copper uptake system-associated protein [Rhodopseudomonas palustris]|uniref:Copper uptake system-associated protein n=1 Tax=Rhodopseudomonas palustris TaxID=1076 RepID=A0A933RZY3_RHOPL|nr:copper uptake system-associated protein [Rhodopseudomonas palustris]
MLLAAALLPIVSAAAEPGDAPAIAAMLRTMFDKPGVTLQVAPVVVSGAHAIADWSQGEAGGRALLRRRGAAWTVVLCAGDAIRSRAALVQAGVAPDDAGRLAHDLAAAERALSPDVLARFSRFDGIVTMGPSGEHPPAAHAAPAAR